MGKKDGRDRGTGGDGNTALIFAVVIFCAALLYVTLNKTPAPEQANPGGHPAQPDFLAKARDTDLPDLSAYYDAIDKAKSALSIQPLAGGLDSLRVEEGGTEEKQQQQYVRKKKGESLVDLQAVHEIPLKEGGPAPGWKGGGGGGGGGNGGEGGRGEGGGGGARDLVTGMAKDIPPENLATFVGSLREHNARADVVLFVNTPISSRHQKICDVHDVIVVEFSPDKLEPPELSKYHPSTYRWPLIKNWLQARQPRYEGGRVLLADVRDTAFQSDPFAEFPADRPGFYVFHDYPKSQLTLGKCGWNGGWVESCFGKEMRQQLYNNQIYCSGISMGTYKEVLKYLEIMDEIIMAPDFHKCERNGVDQGIHNVLVNLDRIPHLEKISQGDGWVGNLQAKTCQLKQNKFYNTQGKLISVAHQYDRRKPIIPYYEKQYSFWKNSFVGRPPSGAAADPVALPKGAGGSGRGTCGSYELGPEVDWFKGICDGRMESGSGPEECCYKCNEEPGCQGFTHLKTLCYLKTCKNITPDTTRTLSGATSGYKKS